MGDYVTDTLTSVLNRARARTAHHDGYKAAVEIGEAARKQLTVLRGVVGVEDKAAVERELSLANSLVAAAKGQLEPHLFALGFTGRVSSFDHEYAASVMRYAESILSESDREQLKEIVSSIDAVVFTSTTDVVESHIRHAGSLLRYAADAVTKAGPYCGLVRLALFAIAVDALDAADGALYGVYSELG
ncbi:hypothetical protein SEA_MISCHIEF19_15 [Streptomyces phage Mischief19]|nr:hypothetical protein SEA_MISCHIEF19_15 [Streptomyces phage Mischief19]